jgi:hypothetical protein
LIFVEIFVMNRKEIQAPDRPPERENDVAKQVVRCNVQHTTKNCNMLQHAATTLQHTAIH